MDASEPDVSRQKGRASIATRHVTNLLGSYEITPQKAVYLTVRFAQCEHFTPKEHTDSVYFAVIILDGSIDFFKSSVHNNTDQQF